MIFYILTLFPEMVMQGLGTSIIGRAIQQNKIGVKAVNIRDFTQDKHGRVDDYTYGGGAGMLMQAQPVYDAYVSVAERIPAGAKKRVVYLTPQGRRFSQEMAREFSESDALVLLCGHYEGVDERVLEEIVTDYVSIGDYVLTGGELAAMVVVDAVARLVPSVLHNTESALSESFHGSLLEYPQYSRPEEWRGKRVPSVLLSGNQRKIDEWRRQEAIGRTRERRPDLYEKYEELEDCKRRMMRDKLHHMDMIQLIDRGRAILVARGGGEIILEDRESHNLFHTRLTRAPFAGGEETVDAEALTDEQGEALRDSLLARLPQYYSRDIRILVLHQPEFVRVAERELGMKLDMECLQAVYTKREKLPISGLYAEDGKSVKDGPAIQPLTMEHHGAVCASYHTVDEPDYIRECIENGRMFGAFLGGELAGFIGIHSEGSIGMLTVFPKYRRKKVALSLETYIFNRFVEQGMIPYGHIIMGNDASTALQEKLGVYLAKEHIFWMSEKT